MGFRKLFRRHQAKSSKVSPANQAQLPSSQLQSKLLAIPGEIRNQIYRLVIVSDTKIRITSTPIPEPALLKTCQAIRREAIAVYYHENKFVVDCPDLNYSIYQEFNKKFDQHVIPSSVKAITRIFLSNRGSWTCKTNLLEFLKAFHEGRITRRLQVPS